MKQVFIVLAVIASIFATIFSVLPISNLAIFPGITALIFGLIAFYFSKKAGHVKKIVQFTFLLTIVALSLTVYKAIFHTSKVENKEELINKEMESKQEALDELNDLELDDINLEQ